MIVSATEYIVLVSALLGTAALSFHFTDKDLPPRSARCWSLGAFGAPLRQLTYYSILFLLSIVFRFAARNIWGFMVRMETSS